MLRNVAPILSTLALYKLKYSLIVCDHLRVELVSDPNVALADRFIPRNLLVAKSDGTEGKIGREVEVQWLQESPPGIPDPDTIKQPPSILLRAQLGEVTVVGLRSCETVGFNSIRMLQSRDESEYPLGMVFASLYKAPNDGDRYGVVQYSNALGQCKSEL
jgi:hypothetical protein